MLSETNQGKGACRPSARNQRFAARADRAGRRRSEADKIDVGVGVYRDAAGNTPILKCVKEAERHPARDARDQGLSRLAGRRPLHRADPADRVRRGMRRRAHRRAADAGRLRRAAARRRADREGQSAAPASSLGEPTWPNHAPLIARRGLEMVDYPYYERGQPRDPLRRDDGRARARREPGDLVLLHGCCHNPTGADLDLDQWARGRGRRRASAA